MDSNVDPPLIQPDGGLEAFTGAHNFTVKEMRFTQAQNLHKHKYVIYNPSGQLIDLFKLLNPIKDASHKRNRQFAPPDSHCLPGTREKVFEEVRSWIKRNGDEGDPEAPAKPICWLYGFVGCGKSAIAQNIAEEYARKDRLAPHLAHQISLNIPGAKMHIERAIIDDPSLIEPTCSLEFQLEYLVYRPLHAALLEGGVSSDDPFLMLIDGLDECRDKQGISTFIDYSIEFFSRQPTTPLRLLITSRIEEHIQTHVEDASPSIHLIDLVSRSSRADVASWPESEDLEQLVDYCDGSFIFGSTLVRFILGGSGSSDCRTPMDRLPLALKINPGLDGVYKEVLSRAQHLPHFHMIVSTVASVQTPISIEAMAALLDISTYEVIRVLVVLQAILQVPGSDNIPVSLFHTSLRDFLVDKTRSGDFHSPPSHHSYIMSRCLDMLFGTNPSTNIECCRYAMVYWALHLEITIRTDDAFDLTSAAACPFQPLIDDSAKETFRERWARRRPLNLVLSEGEWAIMMRNMQNADVALRRQGALNDVRFTSFLPIAHADCPWLLLQAGEISRYYWHDQVDRSQWLLARTEGYGRSCPPIVRVDSSRACSIEEIVEGFCTMLSEINNESWFLYLAIRRSDHIAINLEFERTESLIADDRRTTPGGSQIVILSDLSVGLHSGIK
ncbi:hypothetical protein NMY22_g6178 [Coprinellus aureogranulatus]|nr:hypothetical protein NMY22_g6178 [Coprinellus aureogranulatus]